MYEHREEPEYSQLFHLAFNKRPEEELYDVRTDPFQLHNLATDPGHTTVKSGLRQNLDIWMRNSGDPRGRGEDGGWDRQEYFGRRS